MLAKAETVEDEREALIRTVKNIVGREVGVPMEEVSVALADGCVHLYGKVGWDKGVLEAEAEISSLPGVRSVRTHLSVREYESAVDLKNRIVDAVVHHACLDALRIAVERRGSEVTLGGTVLSQWEEDLAVRVAENTPGVGSVMDKITIRRSD
jgi:osmotically-inducible protein OsmY